MENALFRGASAYIKKNNDLSKDVLNCTYLFSLFNHCYHIYVYVCIGANFIILQVSVNVGLIV